MAYSKVILNGTTLIDVTQKTVDASNLLSGYTALKNDGTNVTGTYATPSGTLSITENNTYDVTNYASVDVNVSGGGGAEQLYVFVEVTGMLQTQAVIGEYTYLTTNIAYYGSALVQGATVTLYTYSDYILNTITGVTSGNTISYTTVTRGTYTFTMPNESVYCSLLYDD